MCFTKEIWTFIFWWLITFEPLEQKQSYIPLLKVLMCGMNAWGAQWHGGIFILQYTSLKMVLLLHKTALVNFPLATTVWFLGVRKWFLEVRKWFGGTEMVFKWLQFHKFYSFNLTSFFRFCYLDVFYLIFHVLHKKVY